MWDLHNGKLRNMASVYLIQGSRILLLYRQGNSIVKNMWIGSAGGHFEKNELNDAKACVLRELYEELAVDEPSLMNLKLRYVTLRNTSDELRINYYYFADLDTSHTSYLPSTEGITKWYSLNEVTSLPMPFTARYMIDHYIAVGQYDDALYGGIANESGVVFTKL